MASGVLAAFSLKLSPASMKILFVSQYFWPERFRANDIAFELARRGHRVTVLIAKSDYFK